MQEVDIRPTLRLCEVERPSTGSCGFHLSRTAWDPYPWVSGVEEGSPAETAGLQTGDCVLEVNGEDVLGQRIGEVASRVRSRGDSVTLLLWNAGTDPHTAAINFSGNGPTPVSLQRLSNCLQTALQLLECPVCLEIVPPPAYQCCHGHILCAGCRSRADKCPVCRVNLGPRGRCLLADKLYSLLVTTWNPNHHSKQIHLRNKKTDHTNSQQFPTLYLKSRIITEISDKDLSLKEDRSGPYHLLQSNTRIVTPSSTSQEFRKFEEAKPNERQNICPVVSLNDGTSLRSISDTEEHKEEVNSRKSAQSKTFSEENAPKQNQQTAVIFADDRSNTGQAESSSELRTRSQSAGQIKTGCSVRKECIPSQILVLKPFPSSDNDELTYHCPYPVRSAPFCRNTRRGRSMLLKHIREGHHGPLIQYFLKPSKSVVRLRLPLSTSRTISCQLISLTTEDDVVFFVQVAAGATPAHRLVWLWILGDAVQAERYRLRLTLPEGDIHTGPVFPLTSSWTDVVNSNCCLSIEEKRYLRGNPEVQVEVLDTMKNQG